MNIKFECPNCGSDLEEIKELRNECDFKRLKGICPNCGAKYRISIFKQDIENHPIYQDVTSGFDEYGYDEDGNDKNGLDY